MKKFFPVYATFIYLFLFAPILVLMFFSFNESSNTTKFTGFSLKWYQKVLHDESLFEALKNTILIASVSTFISTIIGTLAAYAMHKYNFWGRKILDVVFYMPVIIPEIVMAVSLLTFFVLVDITLGKMSIIIGHVAFCISFVVVVVRARLHGFDESLIEAAYDLGANNFKTFFYVTLPLIFPGIISAALLSFTMSIDDFLITHFTAGVGSTTLPLKIYSIVRVGVTPEINAVSTLLLLTTIFMILISQRLQKSDN